MVKRKSWEDLTLSDGFLFGKVMRNPALCQKLIESLLNLDIERIEYQEEEKTIDIRYDSKGVRLDVYVKDEQKNVYNVEIQASDTKELPKRSRYYQSMMDLDLIEKGMTYKKLKKNYVIFICCEDIFGHGEYCYRFENMCLDIKGLTLGDDTFKLFFNTKGEVGNVSEEAKSFLAYLNGLKGENEWVKQLDSEVKKVKKNEEWRKEYMSLLLRDQDNFERGIEQGIKQNQLEITKKLLKKKLGLSEIAEVTGLSEAKVLEIKSSLPD